MATDRTTGSQFGVSYELERDGTFRDALSFSTSRRTSSRSRRRVLRPARAAMLLPQVFFRALAGLDDDRALSAFRLPALRPTEPVRLPGRPACRNRGIVRALSFTSPFGISLGSRSCSGELPLQTPEGAKGCSTPGGARRARTKKKATGWPPFRCCDLFRSSGLGSFGVGVEATVEGLALGGQILQEWRRGKARAVFSSSFSASATKFATPMPSM